MKTKLLKAKPKIDRRSLALHKEHMAKVTADAEREVKRRIQLMPAAERAKFKRFLSNLTFLGEVGKAAGKSRVSRKLLDKWMKTPGLWWKIGASFNNAQALAHGGETARDILFRAKILPQLEEDMKFFMQTGQRHRESKIVAKLAANDLKEWRWQILQAANNSDRNFFIDLGRILNGEVSATYCDDIDKALAEMWASRPNLSTRKIAAELQRRGIEVEEHTIRTRKSRMGLTGPGNANRYKP